MLRSRALSLLKSVCLFADIRLFLTIVMRPPLSPLFPYTTLFRSQAARRCRDSDRQPFHALLLVADLGHRVPHVPAELFRRDRKSTRLNSSHVKISYVVFCLKKKTVVVIM